MKRYRMKVLVRPKAGGPEKTTKINVTAPHEHAARRITLERVYYNHYIATRFLNIRKGKEEL